MPSPAFSVTANSQILDLRGTYRATLSLKPSRMCPHLLLHKSQSPQHTVVWLAQLHMSNNPKCMQDIPGETPSSGQNFLLAFRTAFMEPVLCEEL